MVFCAKGRVVYVALIALAASLLVLPAPLHAQVRIIQVPAYPAVLSQRANIRKNRSEASQSKDKQETGDKEYQPQVGQAGKDALWVPTPSEQIAALLKFADLKSYDYLIDLGSGDGRMVIEAAKLFGTRALGIEYNEDMVELARRNASRAAVQNLVRFRQGDVLRTDFSQATIVTFYLQPALNLKLRNRFMRMRPGTRLLAHTFDLGDWKPDRKATIGPLNAYLWIVPARIEGRWAFEVGSRRFIQKIEQQYQMIHSTFGVVRNGRIKGRQISLTLEDGQEIEGEIDGEEMWGPRWSATRLPDK